MSTSPQPLTLAEFLSWEERQSEKFEYRDGAISAMAGATDDHGQIVANLIAVIRPRLRNSGYRIYPQDMKVVTQFPGSRYPDIVITCDPRDAADKLVKRYPTIIVEVLSQSSVTVDAGDKLDEYETIAELEQYILVDSRKRHVGTYRRTGNKLEVEAATNAGFIVLGPLAFTLSLDEIYEDVDFTHGRSDQ